MPKELESFTFVQNIASAEQYSNCWGDIRTASSKRFLTFSTEWYGFTTLNDTTRLGTLDVTDLEICTSQINKQMNKFFCPLLDMFCPLLEHIAQSQSWLTRRSFYPLSSAVYFTHFQVQALMAARQAVMVPLAPLAALHAVKLLYTATFHDCVNALKVTTHCCVAVRLCFIRDQPDTTGSCSDIARSTTSLLLGADCL